MIYEALNCLADEMNVYFRNMLKITEDKVIISGIVGQDGVIAIKGENKVLITLLNLEKETIGTQSYPGMNNKSSNGSQPLTVNLYVLFSCYFNSNNYSEALRFLSFVITFLQDKGMLDHANTPRLHPLIDRLIFDFENAGTEKLNNIWAMLGAKFMPSVIYKVRMLSFKSNMLSEYRPKIQSDTLENNDRDNSPLKVFPPAQANISN